MNKRMHINLQRLVLAKKVCDESLTGLVETSWQGLACFKRALVAWAADA